MFNRDKLKSILNKRGWTNYRLAKEAGIGQTTVHDILGGKKVTPNAKTLAKIADVLGVSINDFFDEDINNESQPDSLNSEKDPNDLKILFSKIRDLNKDDQHRINAIVEAFKKENQD